MSRQVASGTGWKVEYSDPLRTYWVHWPTGYFMFGFDIDDGRSSFAHKESTFYTLDQLRALIQERGRPLDDSSPVVSAVSTHSFAGFGVRVYCGDRGMAFAIESEDPPIVWELTPPQLIELCYE